MLLHIKPSHTSTRHCAEFSTGKILPLPWQWQTDRAIQRCSDTQICASYKQSFDAPVTILVSLLLPVHQYRKQKAAMLLSAASISADYCVTSSWTEILILQAHNTYLARQLGTVYSRQSAILSNTPWIKNIPRYFCESYAIYQQCNMTAYLSQYEGKQSAIHTV
jgi:hypothetical protein